MELERTDLENGAYILQGQIDNLPDGIFDELQAMKPSIREKVKIFGKVFDCPRFTASYGQNYAYSGMGHTYYGDIPEILTPFLEYATEILGKTPNQALINWYSDGNHYIGKHSDDESQIIPQSEIVSFSLGATRPFRIRRKGKKGFTDIPMPNGTVIIMGGTMQTFYTHEVPKSKKIKDPRINITLRYFKVDEENKGGVPIEALPKVVNVKVTFIRPEYDNLREWLADENNLYIGRHGRVFIDKVEVFPYDSSKWRNPFSAKKYGREMCIQKFEEYIRSTPDLMDSLHELSGKNLGCWCKPESCHGDVLVKLFNEKFN